MNWGPQFLSTWFFHAVFLCGQVWTSHHLSSKDFCFYEVMSLGEETQRVTFLSHHINSTFSHNVFDDVTLEQLV